MAVIKLPNNEVTLLTKARELCLLEQEVTAKILEIIKDLPANERTEDAFYLLSESIRIFCHAFLEDHIKKMKL